MVLPQFPLVRWGNQGTKRLNICSRVLKLLPVAESWSEPKFPCSHVCPYTYTETRRLKEETVWAWKNQWESTENSMFIQILAMRLLKLPDLRPSLLLQASRTAWAGSLCRCSVPPAVRVCGFHQAEGGERETQVPGVGNGFKNIKMEAESKGGNNYCKRQCQ